MESPVRLPRLPVIALTLLLGVLAVQWLPRLPPQAAWIVLALVAVAAAWRWPRASWLACAALGAAWAGWRGGGAMQARLPPAWEGRDFAVVGRVEGLPVRGETATNFVLAAERVWLDGRPLAWHGRLRLAWYDRGSRRAPLPLPCQGWHLRLRLKRPRGLVNPGGADGERSALERGIVATGYVREDAGNAALGPPPRCIDGVRDAVARRIDRCVGDARAAAFLKAFTVGDIRGLGPHEWEVARANGIPHLIAISGFHVSVAAIAGIWFARLLYFGCPACGLYLPRPQAQAAAALLVAAAYSALAGFGLPTVRSLLMIAVVALARCARRQVGGGTSLALALVAILLADPLAVLSAGFWLSFVGVAFLMCCLEAQGRGAAAFLRELSIGQLVMTIALLPLTLWFFGEASLVGALSNLIAVPLVSFVIVPLALLGMVMLGACPPLATPVFRLAAWLVEGHWWLLERMAAWPGAHWFLPEVQPWALALAVLGAWWLFLPRGIPLRGCGALLFLPLLWPPAGLPATGAFRLWMLDVGQGLSIVLRTRHHALVFDTGARYPSGFDLGEATVLPSLHALGIDRLDLLMVSHGDNDHAGGAGAVANAFPRAGRLAGEPERMPVPMAGCRAGQGWVWDGVRFTVLYPQDRGAGRANDHSCVLLVEGHGGRALLTGDIGARVESVLAGALADGTPLVLQVAHHGSRTSSGERFVRAAQPALGLVSAGWRNRFGHPHPAVVARYARLGVPLLNTAERGAIQVDFPADGPPRVTALWRERRARYWRE
jgi:competence protein ComEC